MKKTLVASIIMTLTMMTVTSCMTSSTTEDVSYHPAQQHNPQSIVIHEL